MSSCLAKRKLRPSGFRVSGIQKVITRQSGCHLSGAVATDNRAINEEKRLPAVSSSQDRRFWQNDLACRSAQLPHQLLLRLLPGSVVDLAFQIQRGRRASLSYFPSYFSCGAHIATRSGLSLRAQWPQPNECPDCSRRSQQSRCGRLQLESRTMPF